MDSERNGSMPRVSVIMNCRNGERFLEEAIHSVLAQTYDHFEIILWDNQSTDRTREITESFGGQVRYFRSEEAMTLGAARNEAISRARGEFIAVLDVDDKWVPEKLQRQVELMDAKPAVALVYCDMIRIDADGACISQWSGERPMYRGGILAHLLTDCFVSSSTILIRSNVLQETGAFDTRFTMVEDWDLYLRIAKQHPFDFVDQVLVYERQHGGNTSQDYDALASEALEMLQDWKARTPSDKRMCAKSMATVRFKRAGVRAFRAFRERHFATTIGHACNATGLLLAHPHTLSRVVARYLRRDNLRFFAAKFS